ncbi:MAG TPA: hypothetical protein VGP55_14540 [Chitinophagaceae bacterium]|nr:hypothetical protein [Chitinophagaceae bacterium]
MITKSLTLGIFLSLGTIATTYDKMLPEINTKGFYYSIQRNPKYDPLKIYIDFIFFYDDSTMVVYTDSIDSLDENVLNEQYFIQNKDKLIGRWGCYKIMKDILEAKVFIHDPSRLKSRIPEDWEMKVINDNKILLEKKICRRCKNQYIQYFGESEIIYNPKLEYDFVYAAKPDSSEAWFKKKPGFVKKFINNVFK